MKTISSGTRAGFAVPETLVTNSWSGPSRMAESGDIIFKSLRGVLLRKGVNRALFTTRLQASDIAGLNPISTPYPGLMQPYIEKLREWRVTVVEDATFASAIYATGDGSSDWRQGQMTDSVRFTRDVLDETVESMCIALTKQLGLAFSAIDLIETPDGDFVFLEANPNGQYMWLELQLNLPISEKIADALVTRAFRS